MQELDLTALLVFVIVIGLFVAGFTVIGVGIFRACEDTPDPRNVPGREMRAVGRAVVALLDQTDKSDPTFQKLTFLKMKLLSGGIVASLSAPEMRLAYRAAKFQKTSLISKLADRGAYASPNTLQDYKDSLYFIRKFELKFREGVYIRDDVREG
jgi:hypothetical protein